MSDKAAPAGPDLPSAADSAAQQPDRVADLEGGQAAAAPAPTFGTAEEEIRRLLSSENNYYAALKVDKDLQNLKKNYYKLSRLVHPDKCQHPDAAAAQAVITQAYDTLTNPVKKRLFDAYATDAAEKPDGMTYAEWESRQVEIPQWLQKVLRIPGGGCCLLIAMLLLIPVLVVFLTILWVVCLPLRCIARCCCGVKVEEQAEAAAASGSDPPQHASGGVAPQAAADASNNV